MTYEVLALNFFYMLELLVEVKQIHLVILLIFQEHEMSFKCLEDNSYDRNSCGEYFENYKRCKDFWVSLSVFLFPS